MGTIFKDISIHALRGESDRGAKVPDYVSGKFQSTLSVGRATKQLGISPDDVKFQSTLSVGRATI